MHNDYDNLSTEFASAVYENEQIYIYWFMQQLLYNNRSNCKLRQIKAFVSSAALCTIFASQVLGREFEKVEDCRLILYTFARNGWGTPLLA